MLHTPFTPSLPPTIYPPSEDTYLLLDTLSSPTETSFLCSHFLPSSPSPLLLDLGTGSGTILAFLLANTETIFGRSDVLGLGVDLNADACRYVESVVEGACTEVKEGNEKGRDRKERETGAYLAALRVNLLPCLRSGSVDTLIFNPPYVPSEELPGEPNFDSDDQKDAGTTTATRCQSQDFDRTSHLLCLSYAGGRDGMEVTNGLLADLPRLLSDRGVAYVLLCKANGVEEVLGRVRGWQGEVRVGEGGPGSGVKDMERYCRWRAEVVGSSGKTAGWEKLVVVRIWREWQCGRDASVIEAKE